MLLQLHSELGSHLNALLGSLQQAMAVIPELETLRAQVSQWQRHLGVINILESHSYESAEQRQAIRRQLEAQPEAGLGLTRQLHHQLQAQRRQYHQQLALLKNARFWQQVLETQRNPAELAQLQALRSYFANIPTDDLIHLPTPHIVWYMTLLEEIRAGFQSWFKHEIPAYLEEASIIAPAVARVLDQGAAIAALLKKMLAQQAQLLIWRLTPVFKTGELKALNDPFVYARQTFKACRIQQGVKALAAAPPSTPVTIAQVQAAVNVARRCASPLDLERLQAVVQPPQRALCPLHSVRRTEQHYHVLWPTGVDVQLLCTQRPRYPLLSPGQHSRYRFTAVIGEHLLEINRLHQAIREQLSQLPQTVADKIEHFKTLKATVTALEAVVKRHTSFLAENNLKATWFNKLFRADTLALQSQWAEQFARVQRELKSCQQHLQTKIPVLRSLLIQTAYQERIRSLVLGVTPRASLLAQVDSALTDCVSSQTFDAALAADRPWAHQLRELYKVPMILLQPPTPRNLKQSLQFLIEQGRLTEARDFLSFVFYACQSGQWQPETHGWLQEAADYLQAHLPQIWQRFCGHDPINARDFGILLTGFDVLQTSCSHGVATSNLRTQWRQFEKPPVQLALPPSETTLTTKTAAIDNTAQWLQFIGELLSAINAAMSQWLQQQTWQWPLQPKQWKILYKTLRGNEFQCQMHPSTPAVLDNMTCLLAQSATQQEPNLVDALKGLQDILQGKQQVDVLAQHVARVKDLQVNQHQTLTPLTPLQAATLAPQ